MSDRFAARADAPAPSFLAAHHQPYLWKEGATGALLVHGFPGTPAELLRVGEILRGAGLTVRGMLLPGFGPDILALNRQTAETWLAAVEQELEQLRADSDRVLLVGNSMGAALAMQAAARHPVDGLLLFSPWWRLKERLLDHVAPLAARLFPTLHPLRNADFDDPRTAKALTRVLDEEDLADPGLQEQLRAFSLPTRLLLEVRRVGKLGYAAAAHVTAPALVVHGASDPLAHPMLTARIAQRLSGLAGAVHVDSGHELAHMKEAKEQALAPLLERFAAAIASGAYSAPSGATREEEPRARR